jgi:4-diphosphocytidyl-2-C-methyl-D-erythritol kinase
MRGVGEKLSSPLALPPLPAVLVNPGVPLATRDVFARLELPLGAKPTSDEVPIAPDALMDYLRRNANDLAQAAIACMPLIAEVLHALRNRANVRLARMSGSGPTCFALFGSREEAAAAAQRLAAAHKDWWIAATSLGSRPGRP